MNRFATDPRVTARGDGWTVTHHGTTYQVLPSTVFGWVVCTGPTLDFVPTSDGGFAIGFPDAESAITALLDTDQAVTDTDADGDGDGVATVDTPHAADDDDPAGEPPPGQVAAAAMNWAALGQPAPMPAALAGLTDAERAEVMRAATDVTDTIRQAVDRAFTHHTHADDAASDVADPAPPAAPDTDAATPGDGADVNAFLDAWADAFTAAEAEGREVDLFAAIVGADTPAGNGPDADLDRAAATDDDTDGM